MFNTIIDGTKKAVAGIRKIFGGRTDYAAEKQLESDHEASKKAVALRRTDMKSLRGCSHRGRKTCHARRHGAQGVHWLSPMDVFLLSRVHGMKGDKVLLHLGDRAYKNYERGSFLQNAGAHGKTLTKRALRAKELAEHREAGRVRHAQLIASQHVPSWTRAAA